MKKAPFGAFFICGASRDSTRTKDSHIDSIIQWVESEEAVEWKESLQRLLANAEQSQKHQAMYQQRLFE